MYNLLCQIKSSSEAAIERFLPLITTITGSCAQVALKHALVQALGSVNDLGGFGR